jgi:quinoprotein glucose dehydrogenase
VDLDRGEIVWSVPASTGEGDPGGAGYGPPLATAGGVVFHAGTRDPVLRVHDTATGALVTTFELPAGLHAGAISYRLRPDGPQLLVIAPGGHVGIGSPLGDFVMAYELGDAAAVP